MTQNRRQTADYAGYRASYIYTCLHRYVCITSHTWLIAFYLISLSQQNTIVRTYISNSLPNNPTLPFLQIFAYSRALSYSLCALVAWERSLPNFKGISKYKLKNSTMEWQFVLQVNKFIKE